MIAPTTLHAKTETVSTHVQSGVLAHLAQIARSLGMLLGAHALMDTLDHQKLIADLVS